LTVGLNNIDYKRAECSQNRVNYMKGTAIVKLNLSVPPTVSFTPFKISCTITNAEGQPIGGTGTVTLDARKGDNGLSLPLGFNNHDGSAPIVFPLSLESGDYYFWVEFSGNNYYERNISDTLHVQYGQR
jgi:hypothetical protein